MDNRPIGVFDSGLGGLVAAQILRRRMPNEDIVYFGDTGRMPYGGRPERELMTIGRQNIDFLRGFDVKLILAACGTISTVALPKLEVPIPVFGVIGPAARIVSQRTQNGRVGVIATAATISGAAFQKAILTLNPQLEVTATACPKLVPLIESGHFEKDDPEVVSALEEHLTDIVSAGADTLLLGCTHYLLMGDAISHFLGDGVELIDAGEASAEELIGYIGDNNLSARTGRVGESSYYTSGDAESFREAANLIIGLKLGKELSEIKPMPL